MVMALRDWKGSRIGWLGAVLILWIVLVVAGILQAPRGAGQAEPAAPEAADTRCEVEGSRP